MCRLFALSGSPESVTAELWLLDAPDSLVEQSHGNPDGTGIGIFDPQGKAIVHKAPIAAFDDPEFATDARTEHARTFLAHVRFASGTARTIENTHPFEMDGRLFAHNGVFQDLDRLDAHLGPDTSLLKGTTDSERYFALITREIRERDGDIRAGIVAAAQWIAENLTLYSLNMLLTTDRDVFALRYPESNTLFVLDRAPGGHKGDDPLHHRSALARIRSHHAADLPVVVIASEPMDDDPGWRALEPGELLHVDSSLDVRTEVVLPDPPARMLELHHMSKEAAASQAASGS